MAVLQTQSASITNSNDCTVAIIELNAAYTIDGKQFQTAYLVPEPNNALAISTNPYPP